MAEDSVSINWADVKEQISNIATSLEKGGNLEAVLKIKKGEKKISSLEEIKEKISVLLKWIQEGKDTSSLLDLKEGSKDIASLKEIKGKILLIVKLVNEGKDTSGLLDLEASGKVILELQSAIEKVLVKSEKITKVSEVSGLVKSKTVSDIKPLQAVIPLILELQKTDINLSTLNKWSTVNVNSIDKERVTKTVPVLLQSMKGGEDIQSLLSAKGAKKLGISALDLQAVQGALGVVGKLSSGGALNSKGLLNLKDGASVLGAGKIGGLIPLPKL